MTDLLYTARYDAARGVAEILVSDYLGQQKKFLLEDGIGLKLAEAIGRQNEVTLRLKSSHGTLNDPKAVTRTSDQCSLDAEFEEPGTGAFYGATGYGNNETTARLHAFLCALRQRQMAHATPIDYMNMVIWSEGV